MLGGAVGTIAPGLWPDATGGPGAYALVGMGAVVGATTHAPITTRRQDCNRAYRGAQGTAGSG